MSHNGKSSDIKVFCESCDLERELPLLHFVTLKCYMASLSWEE